MGWTALYSSHSSARVTPLRRSSRCTLLHCGGGSRLEFVLGVGYRRPAARVDSRRARSLQPAPQYCWPRSQREQMSTWRRHRAQRNIRASSIAAPGGEGWTIRDHRAILRSEPYASADLGAASDVTAKSILSEAAPVSPAPAISPQRHNAVIAPAHGDGTPDRQLGSTSWAGSPGRFSACSGALRRSRQDLIYTASRTPSAAHCLR